MADAAANQQQIEYWNQVAGPKWVELGERIHEQIAPIGDTAIARARVTAGERVLDVGCGLGQTSVELARRVGPGGRVLGVDISGPMLARARERAAEAGLSSCSFEQADAQVHAFEPGAFDLLFSRFGVMFFDDPVAAFANLRGALADGGRLCFACWQPIHCNPWMLTPAQAAAQHLELSPPEPGAPGPFAFGDADRVRAILAEAGWSGTECEDLSGDMTLGRGQTLEESVDFLAQMGPAGNALRDASEDVRAKVRESMRTALAPFHTGDALEMAFAAWIVTARA